MRTAWLAIPLVLTVAAGACGDDPAAGSADAGPTPGADLAGCATWTATPPVAVTDADGASALFPSIVSLGDGWGVVSYDERTGNDAYYQRLDASGARAGAAIELTTASSIPGSPRAAWSGTELGVVWEEFRDGNSEIYAARFDRDGTRLGADVDVSRSVDPSTRPAITATADGWAVTWVEAVDSADEDIRLAALDHAGATIGDPIWITNTSGSQYAPAIAATTDDAGGVRLAWHDRRADQADIYTASTADLSIATPLAVTGEDSLVPDLARGTAGWGIAYHDIRLGYWQTYLARVDASGVMVGETRLSAGADQDATFPRIVAVGAVWVAVWQERHGGDDDRIVAQRVGADGALIGPAVTVAATAGVGVPVLAVSAAGEIGVAWQVAAVGAELAFARVVCAP